MGRCDEILQEDGQLKIRPDAPVRMYDVSAASYSKLYNTRELNHPPAPPEETKIAPVKNGWATVSRKYDSDNENVYSWSDVQAATIDSALRSDWVMVPRLDNGSVIAVRIASATTSGS